MAQQQRDINKIDKTILENFYKLVHTQENVRLTAACSTFKILAALKKTKLDKFNENLNYCLDRLIAGLGSARACARRGYGTLLMQVLSSFPVSTDRLFTIAKQKFSVISNETTRDNLLGYYMLIRIILQTKNYERTKSNPKYLEVIYQHIIKLQKIKAYFDYPTSELLSTYHELFHSHMLADIPQQAFGSDSKISHNDLLNIILCDKKEPIRELRSMDNAPFVKFFTIFENEKLLRKPVHPLWVEFGKFVIVHRPQQFKQFCNEVLLSAFFKANHNQLASIGLEIISKLVNSIEKRDSIHNLLPDHVIRTIIVSSMTKSSSLRPSSTQFLKDLHQSNPLVLEAYIVRMISLVQDKLAIPSKTLVQKFAAKQIGDTIRRPQMLSNNALRQRVIKFLIVSSLFKASNNTNSNGNKKSHDDFWRSHGIPAPQNTYENSVRQSLRSSLHEALYIVITACKPLDRLECLDDLIEFSNSLLEMKDCVEYVGTSVEANGSATQIQDQWSEYMTALNENRKIVKKEQDARSRLCPISTLYLFYGMQLIEHSLECGEQLEELAQSTQEVLSGDPNDGSWADVLTDQILAILSATECAPWIRKLCVSIFGSLLPHISETSIDLLCDAIKAPLTISDGHEDEEDEDGEGDNSMMDEEDESMDVQSNGDSSVVKSSSSSSTKVPFEAKRSSSATNKKLAKSGKDGSKSDSSSNADCNVDEDEDSAEDLDEVEVGDDIDNEDDKMSCDESDEDEEEEEESVGQIGRDNSSKKGVGGSEDDDDDEEDAEEEEEEYLDDEQMMKLDSVIADMFKLNKSMGNKKKRGDPSFHLRCLDLVKKVVQKKRNDAEVIKKIYSSVAPLAAKSAKSPHTRLIADKINAIVRDNKLRVEQ